MSRVAPTPIDLDTVPRPYCPRACAGGCKAATHRRDGEITPAPDCALIAGVEAERRAAAGTLPPGGRWVGLETNRQQRLHDERIAALRGGVRRAS